MYADRQLSCVAAAVVLGFMLWATALVLPAPARACLPASAASNFAFQDRLNLAVVGTVTSVRDVGVQEHALVIVAVETVIAGTPGTTLEIGMDPDGMCDHPRGEIGDRVVVAAGEPGADYGVFSPWVGGRLSPYNAATWIIGSDDSITSGPTIDGHRFTSLADLSSDLRATAPPAPSDEIVVFGQAWIAPLITLVVRFFLMFIGAAWH